MAQYFGSNAFNAFFGSIQLPSVGNWPVPGKSNQRNRNPHGVVSLKSNQSPGQSAASTTRRVRRGGLSLAALVVACCQAQGIPQAATSNALGVAYSTPEVGARFAADSDGEVHEIYTYTVGASPQAPANSVCAATEWAEIPVRTDGWLTLRFFVPVDQREAYVRWLGFRSNARHAWSNGELLKRAWSALQRGFGTLAGGAGRPDKVEYWVRMTPTDCYYVEQRRHSVADARRAVRFPVAIHAPGLLGPASDSMIAAMFEIAAHETTHVINLYPFTRKRLDWLRSGTRAEAHDTNSPTSMDAEVRAVSVERCLRQAILPRSVDQEVNAKMWRDERAAFNARLVNEPALAIWDETFQRQYALIGRDFVATKPGVGLETLLGQCALLLRRHGTIDPSARPKQAERVAGIYALKAIRRVTPTILFRDRIYAD